MVQINTLQKLTEREVSLSKLSVVVGVPAYNEEKTIARVILEAQKYCDLVIVCDDGSTDMTCQIAEHLGAVVISHERNRGYGAAMQSIFKRARELKADVLVTLDSDGQHNPGEIPQLIKPIESGVAEVVIGSRFMEKAGTKEMPKYRRLGIKVITKLANSSEAGVTDAQSGFRAYSKYALAQLGNISENGMSASIELLRAVHKRGLTVCEVPITCKYAESLGEKTSSQHPLSHGVGLLMAIIKLVVEDRPLVFLGLPGIASVTVGTVFGVWMLDIYGQAHQITTNIALAAIGFILMGFFMVSTAITLYALNKIRQKIH